MASPGGQQYDENLLASAPAATKAQLQGGYNPDILVEKPTPPPSTRHDIEAAIPPADAQDEGTTAYPSQKQPFYRTKKGLIVIFVVLIVIIAVAVGGGVGGSKKKKSNAVTAPAGSDGQGAGSAGAPVPASAPVSGRTTETSTSTTTNGQNVGSPVTKSGNGPSQPITPTGPSPSPQAQQVEAAANLIGMIVDGP